MAYHDSDLETILLAVQAKLIADGIFSAASCRIALGRDELMPQPGNASNLFALIYPDAGAIDGGLFDGGGANQVSETTSVTVEVFSLVLLDEGGYDPILLTSETRGVLAKAKAVLKSLSGYMLTAVISAATYDILRNPLRPLARPAVMGLTDTPGSCAVTFEAIFDYDLS